VKPTRLRRDGQAEDKHEVDPASKHGAAHNTELVKKQALVKNTAAQHSRHADCLTSQREA
jgi:hypothetical protein